MSIRARRLEQKRIETRNQYWSNAEELVWNPKVTKGFASIPRILPLMLVILGNLSSKNGNPNRVYVDLWCRAYPDGTCDVRDEVEIAYSCGYESQRGVRTWKNNVMLLEELGFIKYVKVGAKEIAIILLINPYLVIANLRRDGNLSDDCWYAILERMKSIGAESPEINAILNA